MSQAYTSWQHDRRRGKAERAPLQLVLVTIAGNQVPMYFPVGGSEESRHLRRDVARCSVSPGGTRALGGTQVRSRREGRANYLDSRKLVEIWRDGFTEVVICCL